MPTLTALKVQNFRNIIDAELHCSPGMNIFYGGNGAGKTSLLECIYLTSTTRSFRSNKSTPLINRESDALSVYARFRDSEHGDRAIGVQKFRRDKSRAKLDGVDAKSSSILARTLPVLSIDPSSFEFIEGGPSHRRTMLDWLVFHVKPTFFDAYKDYVRCLKQRNILLRSDKISYLDLEPWDQLLCRAAVSLDQARSEVAEQLIKFISYEFPDLVDELSLSFRFSSGWGEESTEEAQYRTRLQHNFNRDRSLGHTSQGSHRFDLHVKASGKPSDDVLSRGQKKRLVVCFYLTLASIFRAQNAKTPVLLLDDLMSELDTDALSWLLLELKKIGSQTFVSTLDKEGLSKLVKELDELSISWFHVKHGEVIQEE